MCRKVRQRRNVSCKTLVLSENVRLNFGCICVIWIAETLRGALKNRSRRNSKRYFLVIPAFFVSALNCGRILFWCLIVRSLIYGIPSKQRFRVLRRRREFAGRKTTPGERNSLASRGRTLSVFTRARAFCSGVCLNGVHAATAVYFFLFWIPRETTL